MTMTLAEAYAVLGCESGASASEIRACYWACAREAHPDRNPDDPSAHERFCRISLAYEVLCGRTQASSTAGAAGAAARTAAWTARSRRDREAEQRRWEERLERIRRERAAEFRRRARNFGLKREDLGRAFTLGGRRYVVVGLSGVSGHSILCECGDTHVRFRADFVRLALEIDSNRDARDHVEARRAEEAAVHFMRRCGRLGLEVDDLGRWFTCRGERWQIRGLKPRARSRPIRCESVTGAIAHFPANDIRYALNDASEGEDIADTAGRRYDETLRRDFLALAESEGLRPSDLGARFQRGNQEFTIVGLSRRSRTYRIVVSDRRGQRRRFAAGIVALLLRVSAAVVE